MRFFAPVFLRPCELHWLKLGMRRTSPVAVSVAFHGLVPFTPVRVSNVLLRTFASEWLSNPYPGVDLDTLHGCCLPFAFAEDGTFDKEASAEEKVLFTTEYDGRLVGGIRVPRVLRDGDILLGNRKYGQRAGDLLRSLELK
jgi:hypothetical protein